MKKIYLISAATIIIGILFSIKPYWFKFLWGWQILLLPLVAGILMVLVQSENRSYGFMPKLIAGSLLTGFIGTFFIQLTDYFMRGQVYNQSFAQSMNPLYVIDLSLILSAICFFGGLIGIVIRGVVLLLKRNPESKFILFFKKISGSLFFIIGALGVLTSVVIFLILFFHPSSSLLNMVMVDFKLIEVTGVIGYYLLILSVLFIVLIPMIFIMILGLILFFVKKNFFKLKLFIRLTLFFFLWLTIFILLSSYTESKFEERKAEMKENQVERHFDINDFNNIYISRFVKFDEITIRQGEQFSIITKGSEYDQIGLGFEINDNTLMIKRSELETYYNTDTWTMENDNIPFSAGTKHLLIEITMPDIEKIEIEGGHIELVDFNVDNIEIKLNKRFNNIKGNIIVKDTLKLDANGGIINLVGSAENLIINSGDCWIEMDEFIVENATINAKNTSRLNVNVSSDMEIQLNENSGIINHFLIADKEISFNNRGKINKYKNSPWYPNFLDIININNIELNDISEICLSDDSTKLLAITKGSYCITGLIFQYDITEDTLVKAMLNDKGISCIAWPEEFGPRNGLTISLQGFTVDAGCAGHMYYDYNYVENVVELQRGCFICEEETTEKCYNY